MVFTFQKPIPLGKFSFDVSFHKFHVTKPNRAGCNKIYEIRRSKSFFFELADPSANTNDIHLKIHTNDYHMKSTPISYSSTCSFPNLRFQISKMLQHFFSHQKVIPRSIQKKYFNLIRSKLLNRYFLVNSRADKVTLRNSQTKTFFKFSYKRYRFYLGIFTPCNFSTTYNFEPKHTQICRVPSPYIMSHNRRACVSHQKNLDIFHNIKKPTLLSDDNINNKQFHATLIHKRWQHRTKKHVNSNRLGISYDVSYIANDQKSIPIHIERRMYQKRFNNFRSQHSDRSKRSKKQKSRFQRACRSVFYNRGHKKKKKLHNGLVTLEEKLHRARQHRFLFLPSQHINKPVQHLRYYKGLMLRLEKDYNFPIPPERSRRPIGAVSAITETWHEKLGIWIPKDLLPYVTDEPVYISKRQAKIKGQQFSPGCGFWFDGIRKRKEAHELAVRQQKEHEAWEVKRRAQEEELSARAKLWGTSSNRIEYREDMCKDLTKFQEHFHKKITPLADRRSVLHNRLTQGKNVYKTNKQLLQLEQELGRFNIDYFSVIDDNSPQYQLRPHKRPPILPAYTDRHNIEIKKMRLDIMSPEDSKVFALP
ncbi:hypothetical protein GLOIN_2v1493568 [Rhizophagus irregularis DAOM 181602=DAOM 197198]|uniref:DUF8211 domain-containing protein n=1 Tax=Rhizophagus irregularis (strain DAOM 181602 / DAOM 197198 / MUCL 43194) TaxID=747089 RepID=A0A2P4QYN7_RHIID|nr:hypothetical protein GLOIN_2v1493568 [Rhizophagus irregularis DAOM 181602=DAOM 197198]POG82770.1 hypothetical protein GLOIN_2v1493568 [Rhizophagus irregularis DAOM 181602=DAOM 197198]|eukprot:XP_025189636.1 hypothetical protein GLOIN_2v1493568 [Rhizophagus irregularis DAOM 181602=DAOM 197198]